MPANLLSVTVWADWTSLLHFVDGPPARSRLASLLGSRPWAVPLPSLDCCGQYSSENNCWERTLSLSRRDCSGGSAFASMSEETALFGDAAMCKRFQTLAQRKFEFRSYSSLFTAFHARRVGLLRSVQGPTLISLDSVSLLWYTCAVNGSAHGICHHLSSMGRPIVRTCCCKGCEEVSTKVPGEYFDVLSCLTRAPVASGHQLWACSTEHQKQALAFCLQDIPHRMSAKSPDEE